MLHVTKGSFIQALRDIHLLEDKIEQEDMLLKRYEYLRFGKIRSPLDYDITGYKGKETIREFKVGGSIGVDEKYDMNEMLEKKIKDSSKKILEYKTLIDKTNTDLNTIDEPLRSVLKTRYIEQKKLKYVCKKYPEFYLDSSGMYKYIMRELDKYFK